MAKLTIYAKVIRAWENYKGRKTRLAARNLARQVGRRSMAEVKFTQDHLDVHKCNWEYEPGVIKYKVEEEKNYTPDFRIKKKGNEYMYIEYKGLLTIADRKKMKLVRIQNPLLDIRFVFERPQNKLYKGSKTTYGEWATKNGYKWADNEMPLEWLRECK